MARKRGGSLRSEQLTFQLTGGGASPTSPLQYLIIPLHHEEARNFVEFWHYSNLMPTGKNISFGLKRRGSLYAVIVYGIGVNPYQAKFLQVEKCVEIKRLCRSEPREDYPLSRFINLTTKMLKKSMEFDAVVAFADPEHGHEGIVYKASGFKHHGMTNAEYHLVDESGNIWHRRYAFRMARRNDISVVLAREKLKVRTIKTEPKHRWVRIIRAIKQAEEGE
jgi:hypothetical protein